MINITISDGTNIEYDMVAKFYLETTNKTYIVYTDGEYTNNELNIYAINYDDNLDKFEHVKTKEEWKMILDKLISLGFKGVKHGK